MSGPPISVYEAPNTGIGAFVIGVSAIGVPIEGPDPTNPPFNVWSTIISQYANSPIITQLIQNMESYIDQTANINGFYNAIFNIDTAFGYGLDLWGRILGVSRILTVATGTNFGFEEQQPTIDAFGQAPFYSGAATTSNFALSDSAFRLLLYAKALANITDGTIPSINQLLRNLFPGRGNCYVADNGNMSITYTFKFHLSPVELSIVTSSGVLPKPVGVAQSFSTV